MCQEELDDLDELDNLVVYMPECWIDEAFTFAEEYLKKRFDGWYNVSVLRNNRQEISANLECWYRKIRMHDLAVELQGVLDDEFKELNKKGIKMIITRLPTRWTEWRVQSVYDEINNVIEDMLGHDDFYSFLDLEHCIDEVYITCNNDELNPLELVQLTQHAIDCYPDVDIRLPIDLYRATEEEKDSFNKLCVDIKDTIKEEFHLNCRVHKGYEKYLEMTKHTFILNPLAIAQVVGQLMYKHGWGWKFN